MLALLASIANYENRLVEIFNTREYSEKGVYSVTFYNLG